MVKTIEQLIMVNQNMNENEKLYLYLCKVRITQNQNEENGRLMLPNTSILLIYVTIYHDWNFIMISLSASKAKTVKTALSHVQFNGSENLSLLNICLSCWCLDKCVHYWMVSNNH